MAPKRFASPPSVESSEEIASGFDDSEEEIANSPPSAGPKNMVPPQQKVQQSEASDEEEEEEEEEEEDKASHTVPHSATQNPPLPPPKREEFESDEEEGEETDDEAPEPESALKQELKWKDVKPPSSEDKKPTAPFQRSWSKDDEVRILEALAAHRREHGTLPLPEDLEASLAGSLDNSDYGYKELTGKLGSLKSFYIKAVKRGNTPSNDTDRRILDLSKEVWGGGGDVPESGTVPSDFGEFCEMYPYLWAEMKALEEKQPGLFKRGFNLIENEKARKLDHKIKKQRVTQMKLELRRQDVIKEVTKALIALL